MRHELWVIFLTLFAWPAGIVLGNLLASFLWVPVQWFGVHLRIKNHHDVMHARINEIKAMLDACPNCGHRRSAPELLPGMTASSIVEVSKDTEA